MAGFPHARLRQLMVSVLTAAGRAGLVAQDGDHRIYWSEVPQGAANPALRYFVLDDEPMAALNGPTGTREAELQIDCYAADADTCLSLVEPLAAALEWRREPPLWAQWMPEGRTDPEFEPDTRVYRGRLEYIVSYNPAHA